MFYSSVFLYLAGVDIHKNEIFEADGGKKLFYKKDGVSE